MNNNSTTRFSYCVENYIKYRPGYPPEIIDFLKSEGILKPDSIIADIGSGTGISTALFLKLQYCLRSRTKHTNAWSSQKLLSHFNNFKSIDAAAEETILPDNSIELIRTGAQAFHWFDIPKVKAEFKRILKPAGRICLMWNERVLDANPFLIDYEDLLLKYGTDYKNVRHENIDDNKSRPNFLQTVTSQKHFQINRYLIMKA